MTIINYILIVILVVVIQWFVYKKQIEKISINQQLLELISKQQNIIMLNDEKEITYCKILKHIKGQLNLTFLKECPEEEKESIPKEICDWIDQLIEEICDGKEK